MDRQLKNTDSPDGRKDWKGRSPRWRLNLLKPEIEVLREALESFMWANGLNGSELHENLLEKILRTSEKIETPLTAEVLSYPLLEEDWDFGGGDE